MVKLKMVKDTVMEFTIGVRTNQNPFMKDTGLIIYKVVKVKWYIKMISFMMVTGKTDFIMAKVFTLMVKEITMRANG